MLIKLKKVYKTCRPQKDRLGTNKGTSQVTKVSRVTSKKLKASLSLANVTVTIRETLSNHSVHGRVSRRKPLSKKNIAAHLQFA